MDESVNALAATQPAVLAQEVVLQIAITGEFRSIGDPAQFAALVRQMIRTQPDLIEVTITPTVLATVTDEQFWRGERWRRLQPSTIDYVHSEHWVLPFVEYPHLPGDDPRELHLARCRRAAPSYTASGARSEDYPFHLTLTGAGWGGSEAGPQQWRLPWVEGRTQPSEYACNISAVTREGRLEHMTYATWEEAAEAAYQQLRFLRLMPYGLPGRGA